MFFDEVRLGRKGTLKDQAFELDADGYATYNLLAHLLRGPRRAGAIDLLNIAHESEETQDRALTWSVVSALYAFLMALTLTSSVSVDLHSATHPPQALRLRWIVRNIAGWIWQNKPSLAAYMTNERFMAGLNLLADDYDEGDVDWDEQMLFLRSPEGKDYSDKLEMLTRRHVQSLGPQERGDSDSGLVGGS
jgi:hypothetical protein